MCMRFKNREIFIQILLLLKNLYFEKKINKLCRFLEQFFVNYFFLISLKIFLNKLTKWFNKILVDGKNISIKQ